MTEQKARWYVVEMRPKDGSGGWREWFWTDPTPGGSFKTPDEARRAFASQSWSPRWEMRVMAVCYEEVSQ